MFFFKYAWTNKSVNYRYGSRRWGERERERAWLVSSLMSAIISRGFEKKKKCLVSLYSRVWPRARSHTRSHLSHRSSLLYVISAPDERMLCIIWKTRAAPPWQITLYAPVNVVQIFFNDAGNMISPNREYKAPDVKTNGYNDIFQNSNNWKRHIFLFEKREKGVKTPKKEITKMNKVHRALAST